MCCTVGMTLNKKASKYIQQKNYEAMRVPVLIYWSEIGAMQKKKTHEANIETREMLELWNNLTY
jgi:hypothetical protein